MYNHFGSSCDGLTKFAYKYQIINYCTTSNNSVADDDFPSIIFTDYCSGESGIPSENLGCSG